MINSSSHIIKKQVLDINLKEEEGHQEITERISLLYKKEIGPALDEVTRGLLNEDQFLCLDQIILDVGVLDEKNLEFEFPRALRKLLQEVIFKESELNREHLVTAKISKETEKSSIKHKTGHDVFWYYLKTGMLPWNFDGGYLEFRKSFRTLDKSVQHDLFAKALTKCEYPRRLIEFFGVTIVEDWLAHDFPKVYDEITIQIEKLIVFLKELEKLSIDSLVKKIKKLNSLIQQNSEIKEHSLLCMILKIRENLPTPRNFWQISLPEPVNELLVSLLREFEHIDTKTLTHNQRKQFNNILEVAKGKEFKGSKLLSELFKENRIKNTIGDKPSPMIQEGDSLVVNNAGVILIWPYLQAFFSGLGLMEEGQFKDEYQQEKGVHLLHHLVFPDREGCETEWMLNKLICGLKSPDFVSDNIKLTSEEKQECENLLEAAIRNWPALKKTGPDNLRQTFLQREGILTKTNLGWSLQLERKAYDVLLDRLTWSISVVKLPWNDFLIQTEW